MRSDYKGPDFAGYPYNRKYPLYMNSLYHGYKNGIEETFFYDSAVQNYGVLLLVDDVTFVYKEKRYYLMTNTDYDFESDASFQIELQKFEDGNAALLLPKSLTE